MRIQFTSIFLAVVACGGQPDASPSAGRESATSVDTSPVFEIGLWPGEGIPVIHSVADRLPLRELPNVASPVRSVLPVTPGQRISYDSTRHQTIESGKVRVLAPDRISGRDFGPLIYLPREQYYSGAARTVALDVKPPAAFESLQDRAEGACFIRVNLRVIEASPCPAHDSEKLRVESRPKTLWWIHAVGPEQTSGWLLLSDTTAKVVGRTF